MTTLPIVFNRDLKLIQLPITLKQRPGQDHRPRTGHETVEGTSITVRENCRSVTDEELGHDTLSKSYK